MPIENYLYVSVGLNLALTFAVLFFSKKPKPLTKSQQILEILSDLNGNGSHLLITRIDPMDVFHVSPRDRGTV